jgi:hypothetical protein
VLPKFREMAKEAGRDPDSIEITSFGLSEDLDRVKRLAEMGVARVVPMFPPEKAEKVLPQTSRPGVGRARVAPWRGRCFLASGRRWRRLRLWCSGSKRRAG